MRRPFIAAIAAIGSIVGIVAVADAAKPVTPACVEAEPGDGWRSVAKSIAPAWYASASQAQRSTFANYLANANGVSGEGGVLYAGQVVCYNPASVPTAVTSSTSTTTSSTSTTTATTQPATTTTVRPTTTTTAPPTTTTSSTSSSTTVPSTTSTVPSGACTGAAGQPGSADGKGGCFPGPGRVGIPAGTVLRTYTGSCTLTTANVTLDAYDFKNCPGGLLVRTTGVKISRSKIYTAVYGDGAGYSYTVSDSFLDGANTAFGGVACVNCGFDGWNFTILRTEIVHTNRGAYCVKNCLIQDSWVHATNLDTAPCPQPSSGTCPHASGFRVEQYATLIHNTISCDFNASARHDDLGCSADVTGYPDYAPVTHNTFTNNLFIANTWAAYCAYGGASGGKDYSNDPANATYIVFRDNVFSRLGFNDHGQPDCAAYGPMGDYDFTRTGNVWSNNRWSTGGLVPI